jgi:hypothetical protein
MKILYILAALMLIGIFLMFVSSFKVLDTLEAQKKMTRFRSKHVVVSPITKGYVVAGYLGITFFVVGAFGSIFVLFQVMNRRW